MTRSLHLALLALLLGAGVVFAAPVINDHQRLLRLVADKPAPRASRPDFVLHVDSKTGCVWRVSTADGKRHGDRLPCSRPKTELKHVTRH